MKKHFFLVAGEASGDILGAGLIAQLKIHFPDAVFAGIGGELMIKQGLQVIEPMERLSIMGIVPILKRLPELLLMRSRLAKQMIHAKPDCFIGIDAPVFNTGLEYKLKRAGIKTVHYVSPSVWAWRENRIYKIAKSVSLMVCLFPFELDIYHRHGVKAVCIGHPLADEIAMYPDMQKARERLNLNTDMPVVALLPGSRGTEIKFLIEPFLNAAKLMLSNNPELKFVLPCANQKRKMQIEKYIFENNIELPLILFNGQSREVMTASNVVLLASGTATLEAMLLKKPMVVAYKVSAFSLWIFKKLLKIKQFSLPNLLAKELLVREFIQEDCTPENLSGEALSLLDTSKNISTIKKFHDLHEQLKLGGNEKAANAIVELVVENNA